MEHYVAICYVVLRALRSTLLHSAPKQEQLVKTFTASPDVNISSGKNDQLVSGKNDQLVSGKNDQLVIISCGRIDPNRNISEAWILDLKHGRCTAWHAESSKTGTGACLEQVIVWIRMRHVAITLFSTPKSKHKIVTGEKLWSTETLSMLGA